MAMKLPRLQTVIDPDGAAILDIKRGQISTLNASGAFVWQCLQQGEMVDEIVTELARETGEQIATVDRDVRDFIENLKDEHLLKH